MAKVIYVKANPKADEESITFRISERFIEEYKKCNPDDEIIIHDLYNEKIRFLTHTDLDDMFSGNSFDVRDYALEFASADKYIFAAPLWNLSFPAIFKAYIDYISFAGITFKYTELGSEGLLQNKKAIYIVARGGDYSSPPASNLEMGSKYLQTILGFFGVTDFTTISCELTNVLQGDALEAEISKAIQNAEEEAKRFG